MGLQLLSVQQQGFETDGSGYPTLINCTTAQSAAQAHSGSFSLALTSSAGGSMQATTTNFNCSPGRTYLFGGWARTAVSARVAQVFLLWFQSDGTTASALRASDSTSGATNDASGSWTLLGSAGGTSVVAPLDAFFVKVSLKITATGAGAEVHYFDDITVQDASAPFFKAGRTAQLLLDSADVSTYFNSAELAAKVATDETTTFGATWKTFIVDVVDPTFTASGYYDPSTSAVRSTLGTPNPSQNAASVLSYAPAGALAVGDPVRLISVLTSDYKEGSKIGGAVALDWTVEASNPVGYGDCLHVLGAESPATITGTGSPLGTGASSATGAVAHLHVTAYSAGTQQFKLQDATALNGAYSDISGGAFTNVTAVGAQRLVIPGTIRAYVRCVATIATAACTYAVSCART